MLRIRRQPVAAVRSPVAAFPLIGSPAGRSLLTGYYDGYAAIARRPTRAGHRGRVMRDGRPARQGPLELSVCHNGNVACSLASALGRVAG